MENFNFLNNFNNLAKNNTIQKLSFDNYLKTNDFNSLPKKEEKFELKNYFEELSYDFLND